MRCDECNVEVTDNGITSADGKNCTCYNCIEDKADDYGEFVDWDETIPEGSMKIN